MHLLVRDQDLSSTLKFVVVGDNFTLLLFDKQNYEAHCSSSVNSCTHRNWSKNAEGFPDVNPPTFKSAIWAYCEKTLPPISWLCNNFSNTGKISKIFPILANKDAPPNSLRLIFSLKMSKPFTFFASPFYSPPENLVTMTHVCHSTLVPGHGCSGVVIVAE